MMKIKFIVLSLAAPVLFLATACEKNDEGDGDFIQAKIGGKLWRADNITATRSVLSNTFIEGKTGDESIVLQIIGQTTGSHSFRLTNPNDIQPAILIQFGVENLFPGHRITWTTSVETDVSHFVIERSANGTVWTEAATKPATGPGDYEITLPVEPAYYLEAYYRIRVVNSNAAFQFSQILKVSGSYITTYKPAGYSFPVAGYDGNLEVTLYDTTKRLIQGNFHFKAQTVNADIYTITDGRFSVHYEN